MNNAWGAKRNCPKCESHFYDLNKNPATCPKCNHSFDPTLVGKPRKGRAPRRYLVDEMMMGQKPLASGAAPDKNKKPKPENPGGEVDIEALDDEDAIADIDEIEGNANTVSNDDADDESILEDLKKEKVSSIVDVVKEEEDDEEEDAQEEKKKTTMAKSPSVPAKKPLKPSSGVKKSLPKKK